MKGRDFCFTKQERKAILLLSAFLILLLAANKYLIRKSNPLAEYAGDIQWIPLQMDTLIADNSDRNISKISRKTFKPVKKKARNEKVDILFTFDPNQISADSLQLLPLNVFARKNLIKYRDKGGTFYDLDDVSKVYGMKANELEILKPFIRFPKPKIRKQPMVKSKSKILDLNTCSREDLMAMRGIGPVLSQRIIKFRNKLGGFTSADQLREVYGLPDSIFTEILPYLTAGKEIQTLSINSITLKELASHPYINWNQAKVIIKYRDQHFPLNSTDDLNRIKILDSLFVARLEPYLSFD